MNTIRFKTTLNCSNCVGKTAVALDNIPGMEYWNVDTDNPQKILTATGEQLSEADIIEAVESRGFMIEKLQSAENNN